MTRLTFNKNSTGDVLTTKEYIAREKVINANILIKDDGFHYVITNLANGVVLNSGITKTITQAKNIVKDLFKDYGVIIQDEVRKKI